jgi:hypothetical protein
VCEWYEGPLMVGFGTGGTVGVAYSLRFPKKLESIDCFLGALHALRARVALHFSFFSMCVFILALAVGTEAPTGIL